MMRLGKEARLFAKQPEKDRQQHTDHNTTGEGKKETKILSNNNNITRKTAERHRAQPGPKQSGDDTTDAYEDQRPVHAAHTCFFPIAESWLNSTPLNTKAQAIPCPKVNRSPKRKNPRTMENTGIKLTKAEA